MTAGWDVLGLGAVAVDDIYYLDHYPLPDTKVPIREHRRFGGGLAGTALVAAARLGAITAFAGVLGDDELSAYVLDGLATEGIDCSPVVMQAESRPIHSIIIVDRSTGQRSILPSFEGVTALSPEQVSAELVARCKVLFLDQTTSAGGVRAADLAHQYGIEVVGDAENDEFPAFDQLLARIDHLIVGVDMAHRLTGKMEPEAQVQALARSGRACSLVTAGDRGGWYTIKGARVQHFPACSVPVVDTTGCGDVFHGAYAACLAFGMPITRAIEVANASAALKATQPGGRAGIPDFDRVKQFIEERHRED
jgi:ribokinase